MVFYKKLEKLVNMIKKYEYLLIFIMLITSKSHALSPKFEQELYTGCFKSSLAYIGLDYAKVYCTCTVEKLSKKFSDVEIEQVFKMKPEEIIKATKFATIECENHK